MSMCLFCFTAIIGTRLFKLLWALDETIKNNVSPVNGGTFDSVASLVLQGGPFYKIGKFGIFLILAHTV